MASKSTTAKLLDEIAAKKSEKCVSITLYKAESINMHGSRTEGHPPYQHCLLRTHTVLTAYLAIHILVESRGTEGHELSDSFPASVRLYV